MTEPPTVKMTPEQGNEWAGRVLAVVAEHFAPIIISSGYEGQDALNEAAAFLDTWYQGRENWPKTHRLESLLVAYANRPKSLAKPDASDLERASAIALRWAYIEGRRNPQDVRPLESNIAAALAVARRAGEIAMQERCAKLAEINAEQAGSRVFSQYASVRDKENYRYAQQAGTAIAAAIRSQKDHADLVAVLYREKAEAVAAERERCALLCDREAAARVARSEIADKESGEKMAQVIKAVEARSMADAIRTPITP